MRRKIFTSLLMILVIATQSFVCTAEESVTDNLTDGVFSYYIKEEKAVLVSCNDKEANTITIPARLGKYELEEIEGGAFSLCENLKGFKSNNKRFRVYQGVLYKGETLVCYPPSKTVKTYTTPDFVKNLASCAFFGNTFLTAVTFNDNIIEIPAEAFAGCTSLHTVNLSENTVTIDDGAFAFCSSLKKFIFPDSLEYIGDAAFYGCSSLLSPEFGNNLNHIGEMAFKDCISIEEINIPEKITDIKSWIFSVNPDLKKITIDKNNTSFIIHDDILYTYDMKTLVLCPSYVETEIPKIPDGVNIIGRNSFENHKTLKKITLPDTVTEIGDRAFYNAQQLSEVTLGNGVTSIGDYAFYGCQNLGDVTVTEKVTSVGEGAFDNCTALTLHVADGSAMHDYALKSNAGFQIDPNQPAVPRERWSQKYINWAEKNGIAEGVTDYTQTINQEGFCWLIMNYYESIRGAQEIPENPFSDTSSPAVLKACGLGFAQGLYENVFAPARPITRQEMCVNLFHLITALNGEEPERGEVQTFRDSEELAVWAVSYVSIAYNNSIISGLPDGRINPEGHATIEEALGMLYNASLLIENK